MWDPIMQVGKTPQITADITSNPYLTPSSEEITSVLYLYATLGSGATIQSGTSVLAITDQFIDYLTGTPCIVNINQANPSTSYVTADIGKNVFIRGITLYFSKAGSTAGGNSITLEISDDGTNWSTLQTLGLTALNVEDTFNQNNVRGRYLRIRMEYGGGGSNLGITLRKLRVWLDSKQNFA
jgi:hypothetical protein